MAQYNESTEDLLSDFNQSDDLSDVSKDALNEILLAEAEIDPETGESVTVVQQVDATTGGGEPVVIDADTDLVEIDASQGIPEIIVPAGKSLVIVVTGADGSKTVVEYDGGDTVSYIGGDGSDFISFITVGPQLLARDAQLAESDVIGVTVESGAGNDTIETSFGDDSVIGGAGDDSVSTGAGDDSIGAGVANDTVDAGEGWDQIVLDDGDYDFEVVDGEVIVTDVDTGETLTSSNAEYIDLGDGSAIVNAADREAATAARQAEAVLGRQMTSDELRDYNEAVEEVGLDQASRDLMDSSGFLEETADLTDAEFIDLLYERTLGRSAEEEGQTFYQGELADGTIDRGKLAADLAWSDEGVDSNDMVNTIDGLV